MYFYTKLCWWIRQFEADFPQPNETTNATWTIMYDWTDIQSRRLCIHRSSPINCDLVRCFWWTCDSPVQLAMTNVWIVESTQRSMKYRSHGGRLHTDHHLCCTSYVVTHTHTGDRQNIQNDGNNTTSTVEPAATKLCGCRKDNKKWYHHTGGVRG